MDFGILNVRLLVDVDKVIRSQIEYQGDISRLVTEVLENTELETVQIPPFWGRGKS